MSTFDAAATLYVPNLYHHFGDASVLTPVNPAGVDQPVLSRAILGEVTKSRERIETDDFVQIVTLERRFVLIDPYPTLTNYWHVKIGADVVPWAVDAIDNQSETCWTVTLKRQQPSREQRAELEE